MHTDRISDRAEEIHRFWFADSLDSAERAAERMQFWFSSDSATDTLIRERYTPVLDDAANGRLAAWQRESRSCLALIVVLDQFPRNIHRSTPAAFGHDAAALDVARRGMGEGHLERLHMLERSFFLMPFQHSEELATQIESVALFEGLANHAPPGWSKVVDGIMYFARLHHDIIARFGRFPHRNAILGRASTPAEQEYLATSGQTFGQSAAGNAD